MLDSLRNCGAVGFLVALLGVMLLVPCTISIVLAFVRPRVGAWLGVAAAGLALFVAGGGVIGTAVGRSKVDAVVGSGAVDPAQAARIREVGYAEAASCTSVGLVAGALPLILGAVAAVAGFVRKSRGTS